MCNLFPQHQLLLPDKYLNCCRAVYTWCVLNTSSAFVIINFTIYLAKYAFFVQSDLSPYFCRQRKGFSVMWLSFNSSDFLLIALSALHCCPHLLFWRNQSPVFTNRRFWLYLTKITEHFAGDFQQSSFESLTTRIPKYSPKYKSAYVIWPYLTNRQDWHMVLKLSIILNVESFVTSYVNALK